MRSGHPRLPVPVRSLLWLVLSFGFAASPLYGQDASEREAFEELLEGLFTPQDDDTNYEEQYEVLFQLYTQPLNLNTATIEDLQQLYVLSDRQINNLLRHRELYGDFLTIYELGYVPAWHQEIIFKVLPFVTVAPRPSVRLTWSERLARADHLLIARHQSVLEPKAGYIRADTLGEGSDLSYYTGSPHQLYARWRMSRRNDFSVGFTAEKDAGEQIDWQADQHRYGMDYYSGHLQLENRGRLRQLTVGDYQVQAGQGLVLGSGFVLGKGAEPVRTVARTQNIIRPHTSVAETGFFRGIASTVQLPAAAHHLALTSFVSYQKQDAIIDSASGSFASIQTTGLHRTPSERAAQNQLGERALGANLLFRDEKRQWQAGLTYVHTRFSHTWQRNASLQSVHEFSGQTNYVVGGYANYRWQAVHAFGEAARSASGGLGAVGGATVRLSAAAEMAVLLRHYSPDFHSFHANAFSEGTRSINEQGLYWGLKLQPWRKLTVSAYYDRFRFPWLRYLVDAPSDGYEFFTRMSYPFSRQTEAWVQFRQESKALNVNEDSLTVRWVLPGLKRSVATNLTHRINDQVRLRTRVQASSYALNDTTTRGFTVAQDVSVTHGRWKADLRFALFEADFVNRQYVYENDVLYAFAIPAYSGSGVRNYLVLRYKANRHLSFWTKLARATFYDRDEVGSSLERIEGRQRTNVKFQVVVKW